MGYALSQGPYLYRMGKEEVTMKCRKEAKCSGRILERGSPRPGLAVFMMTISQEYCWTCHFSLPMYGWVKVL